MNVRAIRAWIPVYVKTWSTIIDASVRQVLMAEIANTRSTDVSGIPVKTERPVKLSLTATFVTVSMVSLDFELSIFLWRWTPFKDVDVSRARIKKSL